MRVEVSKTQLRAYGNSIVEVRSVISKFDAPDSDTTVIYENGEPILVIEPDLPAIE